MRRHRRRPDGGAHVVELSLINAQEEPPANKDIARLFQPKLTVTAARWEQTTSTQILTEADDEAGDAAVFCPIDDPLEDLVALAADPEERHLRLLYRTELRHVAGRNVATHARVRDGEQKAYRLETRWLPVYDVPATRALPVEGGRFWPESSWPWMSWSSWTSPACGGAGAA
jgi:hypothetical protein